jgi:hypothetical protein
MRDDEFRQPSRWRQLFTAAGWGAAVFLSSLGAQWLIYEKILHVPGGMRIIGSILSGILTSLLAYRLESETVNRRRADLHRFQIISEMNHHIRNAVQVISYHAFVSDPETHGHIREALDRIEWVLRDVLPQVNEPPGTAGQAAEE